MPTQTKKITFDTVAIFLGKFFGLLFGIIRLNYLATYLGVGSFGILNFALFFCSLFLVLFDLGLSQIIIRNIARDTSVSLYTIGRTIILKIFIVFGAGLLVGLTGIISTFDNVTNWAILLTTAAFVVNGLSMVFLSAFQAHRMMKLVAAATVISELINSIVTILLIQNYPYVVTALIVTVAISLLNLIFLFWMYRKKIGTPDFKFDLLYWKNLLKESSPIAVSSLGISIYLFIGSIILKYSHGDYEIGIYSSAYKIISILTLIPASFNQVVFPIFSEFFISAKEKLSKALSDSTRVMAHISFPIGIGGILLAPKIFNILYPIEFSDGIIVFQILMLGVTLGYLNWIMYGFLLSINRQLFSMVITLSAGVIAILAGIIFIPTYGYIFVAYMSLGIELFLFVSQYIYLNHLAYRPIKLQSLSKTVFATLIMAIAIYLLDNFRIILIISIGTLIYFGSLMLVKGMGDQEKEIIRKIISGINNVKH